MKEVVLIRHGESEGQVARHQGLNRKDARLLDCFLTPRGIKQALTLPPKLKYMGSACFQLVCTSPLTRAFATCCLGFSSAQDSERAILTLVHADLAEVGSFIPENTGRPVATMLRDVKQQLRNYPSAVAIADSIDFSLVPESWPDRTRGSIDNFLNWLQRRPESSIAIVCHQNVIQRLLNHTVDRVPNCTPIRCVMDEGSNALRLLEGDHRQALPPIHANNPISQPCRNNGEPLRPVRLGLCSKLEQKKPDCVLFVEPVAGTIIQRAAKKYAWKGMNKNKKKKASKTPLYAESPQFMIRRVTDGRQTVFVQDCGDVLDWLRDGDVVYVGPGLVSTVVKPLPMPPSLAVDCSSVGGPVGFESLCPEIGRCRSKKPPILKSLAPISLPPNQFPLLESNVLEEIRAAVQGDKSFLEKRTVLPNMELSFLSFDYEQLNRDSLLDPNEGSHISRREKRRRALRRECRGLLLDPDTGQVIARRLHKFWNIGETFETTLSQLPQLDERCVLTEKVDGSLVSPFLAHGELVWASKRVTHVDACAHAEAHPCLSSFALYCITELDSTPIFEWVDPKRPIVVRYESPRLVLIAVRHMRSGEYMPDVEMRELASKSSSAESPDGYKIDVVPRLEIDLSVTKSVAELAEWVAALGPGREGGVLRFSNDTFIKMKSEWYVTRHDTGLVGCGTSSATLARLIKYQLPGPIAFTEIPLAVVLSASLARTIDDVIPMLKYQTSAAEKFKTFDDSVSHGLLELHERLLGWGSTIHKYVTGTKSDLNRRIEALSYTTNTNATPFPWTISTLHLYARTGCSTANTAGSTDTPDKAFASLRKDLRALISDATRTAILAKSLKVDWPPQPEESLSFETESHFTRTEGAVCLEQGIAWDSVLVEEQQPKCENGVRRILTQLFSGTHTGRVAVVLRGLPGSGKSTVAGKLLKNSGVLCSADLYLRNDILKKGHSAKQRGPEKKARNESYSFTKERLAEAHRHCFSKFQTACQNPTVSLVVCDNTNITEREIVPYLETAASEDLELVVIEIVCKDEDHVLACQRRNIHLVDASTALRRFHQLKRLDAKYMPNMVLVRPGSVFGAEEAHHLTTRSEVCKVPTGTGTETVS